MTGNDIVDLAAAAVESDWKRKGFLNKLFTWQEQRYIYNADSPDAMLWRLWTMKESAYKIYTRQHGGRFFAPTKFACSILNNTIGSVRFANNRFQTITKTTNNYIYSIAGQSKNILLPHLNNCLILPHLINQQQYIYKKIIEHYARLNSINANQLSVVKDTTGIPFIFSKTDNSNTPVSITHHGQYAAFTF